MPGRAAGAGRTGWKIWPKPQSLHSLVGEEISKLILRMRAMVKECKLGGTGIRESFPEEEDLKWILNEKVRTRLSGRELEKGFCRKRTVEKREVRNWQQLGMTEKGFFFSGDITGAQIIKASCVILQCLDFILVLFLGSIWKNLCQQMT